MVGQLNTPGTGPRGVSRRSFLALGLGGAVAGVGLLAGCGSNQNTRVSDRHADGILQIGVAEAPSDINPLDSGSEVTRWIAEPVVETLYRYDANLASVPLLAAGEPKISADQLTWTIPLRSDITWQNGDPFIADDVVATLAHVNDLSAGSEWITYFLGYVKSYSAPDAHTVEIVLARPYGLLRSHLTNLPIVHRDYVKRRDAMMGTGPYRLDSYVPGQSFTMSAYDGYHGDKPAFKGIVYTVFADGATRIVSLKQGKVDLITSPPYRNLSSLQDDPSIVVTMADAPVDLLTYVLLDTEPFKDENFRRAVAVSMDRAGVLSRIFSGHATAGQGPIGPAEKGWAPPISVFAAEPDVALAKSLLAKAQTTRRDFTLTIGTGQTVKDIAQVLVAGWAQAGITVTIEELAGGPWSQKWLSRGYEMLMNTFQSGFTSGPANYLTLAPAASTNVLSVGYVNPRVDELMATVWATSDDSVRADALHEINLALATDAVIFPPAYPKLIVAQRKELSTVDEAMLRISRLSPQTLHFQS